MAESIRVSIHIARPTLGWASASLRSAATGTAAIVGPRQRLDIVVGDLEEAVLKIEELAGHVDRHDLALAVAGHLVAIGEAAEQQRAHFRRLALADDIGGRFQRPIDEGEVANRLSIVFSEGAARFEASQDALDAFGDSHHRSPQTEGREREKVSRPPVPG